MTTLTGIFPVLPTPFRGDGSIDPSAFERVIDFVCAGGADGVVFPGFASEVETLSADERRTLLEVASRRISEGTVLVAGASAPTVDAVIGHGRVATDLGVDTIMVQPPIGLGSDARLIVDFMSQVARGLPDARFVLQNAPAPRGSDLSPETMLDIVRTVPQIAYVKEETLPAGPAISHLLSDRPDTLRGVIGGGGARYVLDEYARGACAAMPAAEIADLHVALDRAWRSGQRDEARDLYVRTLPLLTLQAVYRMRLTKHVLMQRGVLHNVVVRAPTPLLDSYVTEDIYRNLSELALTASSREPVAKVPAS